MSKARDKANIPALNFSSTGIDDNATSTAITIDSSQRVGIGIASPTSPLMVQSNETYPIHVKGANPKAILLETTGGETSITTLQLKNSAYTWNVEGGRRANTFTFYANTGAERMCIDGSGNVGIGTSSPSQKLEVSSSTTTLIKSKTTAGAGIGGFQAFNNDSTEIKLFSYGTTYSGTFAGLANANLTLLEAQNASNLLFSTWGIVGGSYADIIFATQRNQKVIIKSDGKVGIGTSSPSVILEIAGEGTSGANNIINTWSAESSGYSPAVTLRKTRGTKASPTVVQSGDQTGVLVFSGYDGTNHINTATIESRVDGTPGTNDMPGRLVFFTTADGASSPTERMRINSSGNVGIGTTSPNVKLEVQGSSALGGGTGTTNAIRIHDTSSGSSWSLTQDYNQLQFSSGDTSAPGGAGVRASIGVIAQNASNQYSSLVFRTYGGTERMRIVGNSGAIGIANTAPNYNLEIGESDGVSNRGLSFNLNNNVGQIRTRSNLSDTQTHYEIINSNGTVGTIRTVGSATQFNTSSDYRLKENVNYDFDATTRLKQLKPARFNFIADADTTVDGFLAHEVQDIVPEAISGEKDAVDENGNPEYQGIDQSKLVPLLVKTIQELEARITALETQP